MQGFDVSELVPRGFVVESAMKDDDGFIIAIRGTASVGRCPTCGSLAAACTVSIEENWRIFRPQACE